MIEVEWKVNVSSGITEVELSDLNVKNKKEWEALTKDEQKKKLAAFLKENETYICPVPVEW